MKRGQIVATKRFLNKNGKMMLNVAMILSIVFCLSTFIYTRPMATQAKNSENVVSAAEYDEKIKTLEIISYNDNQVRTVDGNVYFFEDAKTIIENIQGEDVSYKAVIVNGKCTSILTNINDMG